MNDVIGLAHHTRHSRILFVIPAKAGIQCGLSTPEVTVNAQVIDSRLRGNDARKMQKIIIHTKNMMSNSP